MDEWLDLVNFVGLIEEGDGFKERDAKLCFVISKLTSVDEFGTDEDEKRRPHALATFLDFLEILARVSMVREPLPCQTSVATTTEPLDAQGGARSAAEGGPEVAAPEESPIILESHESQPLTRR